ncbi:MAG: S41 family peptidase [Ferruginibacter sp.]
MKILAYLFTLLLANSLFAQQPGCNCEQAFEKLIIKVETEYPGFTAKTKEQSRYKSFKKNLAGKAKKASNSVCPGLLKEYTDFFKDPHLWVGANGSPFSTVANTVVNTIAIDIQDFQNKLQFTKDEYEGIWANESYKLGVKKTGPNEYTGFIIEAKSNQWKPKDIKFRLFSNGEFEYAMLDRSLKNGVYELIEKDILLLQDVNVTLVKQTPAPALSSKQAEEKLKELDSFYFKRLTPKTAVLKLPSFEYQHLQTITGLIKQNKSLLEESGNLIIDLRGNPGGTTDAYHELLPYISGKTIRHTGTEFLATQTYINNLEAYKKTLDKNVSTGAIDSNIKRLKENLGKFVNFYDAKDPSATIEQIELASKSPGNIIILANHLTGSSAEYFLFIAKQSKKVKIFGKPSYGALDYGNAYLTDLGCSNYQVFMPTYRALRLPDYPIDNIGIQPDVYLDKSVKNWVEFAVDYLEK